MKTDIIDRLNAKPDWAKPNKAQPQHSPQWYGAFDSEDKLRATFDSESEAFHYVRNRGHMHGGSDKPIVNHADKLAEALLKIQSAMEHHFSPHDRHWCIAKARATLAAYEAAQ